jgi:hypothetical protein
MIECVGDVEMGSEGDASCGSDGNELMHAPKRSKNPAYMFNSSDGGDSSKGSREDEDIHLKAQLKDI